MSLPGPAAPPVVGGPTPFTVPTGPTGGAPADREPERQPAEPPVADHRLVSLVIPVFNEAESLDPLYAEIAEVAAASRLNLEIVFVDDGSTDTSWATITRLAAADGRVRGIRFRRNFGKAAALAAGFKAAHGKSVLTLDADLQDDPHEIPRFLAALDEGREVVSGWKKVRHDPWHKVWPSRVFNRLVGAMTGVRLHDHNCGMKAYRAEVLQEVRLYGELHRFVPVLAAARGFTVGELVINHRPRKFGHSKYGVRRFMKGLLDLVTVKFLTGFGHRPQHLLGNVGLIPTGVGLFGLFLLAVNAVVRLASDHTVGFGPNTQIVISILSVGLLLFGAQLVIAGLVSELIVDRDPDDLEPYSVSERTTPHMPPG
jgi:dolichol-phosphate mannosyltransferase